MELDFTAASQLEYSKFFLEWPWIGLGACIVILILAFGTNFLRKDASKGCWHDPAWLAWLGAAAYMLHNIEEYGIAANGMTNAFPAFMYAAMGFQISEAAYLACNLGLVWVMGPLAAVLARRHRGMAACMSIFELVNGLSHVAQAAAFQMYNPGLLTSVVIFIPLCIWTLHVCFGKKGDAQPMPVLWGQLAVAAVYHVLLFGGIFAARAGVIDGVGQGLWMVADAIIGLGGWYLIATRLDKGGSSSEA